MISFKELREQLTDESIKNILGQFNVEPAEETSDFIVFPTCCHNLEGGSNKLYYYKDSKLFHCYTECNSTFDIFSLLQKMYALRGKDITLREAVSVCDLDTTGLGTENCYNCADDLRYLQSQNNYYLPKIEELEFKTYPKDILKKFTFDYVGLMPWIQEGINIEALQQFNIKYDDYRQAIVIPNFNYDGELIGIRERYFKPEDIQKGKYRPLYDNKILYNHPTGRTFYGIYENHKVIERKHMCVIYEGEKSVLKHCSIYGAQNNVALATLGQNITRDHIQYLLKMEVRYVILAYDSDYQDNAQLKEVEQRYIEKAKLLAPYFNVSILMDYDFDLPYKSSPIDGGKEIFEKILSNRRIIQ